MEIKNIFSLLSGKGYENFVGSINAAETIFIFSKGRRPDKITISYLENGLFSIKLNIKKTVYNIDKSEHISIDLNKLMIILREL